jgi:hypothetical protein
LLAIPFQTPYEISFALQPQISTRETTAHISFIYVRRHFHNCECSASGEKIWNFKWHELQT